MKEFKIQFSENQIDELRKRIACTRLPPAFHQNNWERGTNTEYLIKLLAYWRTDYNWFRKEKELNRYAQFICTLDDINIHFFYIRSTRKNALPILLTHGWPDSFLRYAKIFSLLPDYDLIVPSLPGFAFSSLPQKGYSNNAETAELWHKLMTQALGYKEYIAAGGDMGRGVTCYLAARHPQEVKGIYLTDVGLAGDLLTKEDTLLSPEERNYKSNAKKWLQQEGAYINIQSTKPQTLAHLLSDSPAGMAAWITEKYHDWSEWNLLTMDDLLDCCTLYWVTNTAATSIRAYYGNSFTLPPMPPINVPTAIAKFPYDVLPVPRAWIEKHYPVIMYTEMAHGGHFTALEQPKAFAENLSQFIKKLSN